MKKLSSNINTQTIWYLFGVMLPMATLFLRSPIYTRIYSTELYGKYTLIFVTFTYLSSVFFQWISSSSWRFYHKYKNSNRHILYCQTILGLYGISIIILAIITIVWYFIAKDILQKKLILLGFLYCTSQELINTYLIPMRMREEAKKFNVINGFRSLISFITLLALTFLFNYQIEAFFLAPLIINVSIIIIIFFQFKSYKEILEIPALKQYKLNLLRFTKYGLTTLVFSTSLFILATSDRYVILVYNGFEKVGIYNQTYNIAQISIAAILGAITAALNPLLLSNLEKKPNQSDELLSKALYYAVYLSFVLTLIFSLFSRQITSVLLGPEFREAYMIMPWIFFSAFLNGISHFASLKLKFKNMFRHMLIASLAAALINILLNFWWIPILGYKSAAYTTFIAYLFFGSYVFIKAEINPFIFKETRFKFFILLGISILLIIIHYVIAALISSKFNSTLFSIFEGVFLLGIYFLFTYRISPFRTNLFQEND